MRYQINNTKKTKKDNKDFSDIISYSKDKWDIIFPALNIPYGKNKHSACPIPGCGGRDRYRYDNKEGRGTFICNQCGAGDGFKLISLFYGCSFQDAIQKVAEVLNLQSEENVHPKSTLSRNTHSINHAPTLGQSEYLTRKGICLDLPVLGQNLCLELRDIDGNSRGYQQISPSGDKKNLVGTKKQGAFWEVPCGQGQIQPEETSSLIICEGAATAISVSLFSPDSRVVSSMGSDNLIAVAETFRERYPERKIIIAGDNDTDLSPNKGRDMSQKAAAQVEGFCSIPDDNGNKCDWDDYRQKYGVEVAREHFFSQEKQFLPKTKFRLKKGAEGYDHEVDYLLKGLLPQKSFCSIFGASGSYKSFLAVSWACHISQGLAWDGHKVTQGSVIYIAGEGGVGIPRRIQAWSKAHNQNVDDLYVIDEPVFPSEREDAQELLNAVKIVQHETGHPVKLIIIDTLARCFGNADENVARDMGAFVKACDFVKERTGATILVVHHSGKDENKGARGSSSLKGALDAEFQVSRETYQRALILKNTKMKDLELAEDKAYDLEKLAIFTDKDGDLVTSLYLNATGREPIIESDKPKQKLTQNHVATWECIRSRTEHGDTCTVALVRDDLKALNIDTKNFRRWLTKLENEDLIEICGEILLPKSKRTERQNE